MKIHLDPVIASRIRSAWAGLSGEQQKAISPTLLAAHQQAVTASSAKVAPSLNPAANHNLLLAHAALTGDSDSVVYSLEAGVVVEVDPAGQIWGTAKYQQLDPGWTEAAAVWLEHVFRSKHAFSNDPPVIKIPDSVQIALAGDWGTGDWRSAANPSPSSDVARHLAFLQPHITIHLGDVYYAGTGDQEQHLLVKLWPAGSIGALTLNSNHEMYSGGTPYFDVALASPLFGMQKNCSYFALENTDWVIVGLDSAYYASEAGMYLDGSLGTDGAQVNFLKAQVAKGKKVMVLTHHNGLSQDGKVKTLLWDQVMSAFPPGQGPTYWYWGHVHAGVVYSTQNTGGVLCRCCGHGALPWGQSSELADNADVTWYEHRSAHDPDIPERVLNGFAVLYLSGPNIHEVFYDENGGVAWP
jgi:Calcineurin-like phosphoesterase